MNLIREEGGRFHSGSLNRMSVSISNYMHNDDCSIPMDNHSYNVTENDEQNLQTHNRLIYNTYASG